MDSSPTPASQRRDPDSGRVAVPEIAELLHLQRPAAALAAAVVVLLGLVVALVLPDVVPANALTGAAVGILALLAAVAAAVVLDGRDPVLRGPRHLRRDGHTVLARMAGPDAVRHGAPVLAALERRLEGREHLSVVLTGSGTDPSELAVALGRGAAAAGHTALVVDLRAPGAPGVADVGEGTVRLGEAAQLADDRPYAWIGAGADRASATRAAAGVARRPPRDLQLLLVVAPEAATHLPEVLAACERTILLVAADTQQRAMVTARVEALRRAGARPETVVVGGVRAVDDGDAAIDTSADRPSSPGGVTGPVAGQATGSDAAGRPAAVGTATEPDPGEPEADAPPVTDPDPDGATRADEPAADAAPDRGTGSFGPSATSRQAAGPAAGTEADEADHDEADEAGHDAARGRDTRPDDAQDTRADGAHGTRPDDARDSQRARDEARRERDDERQAREDARRARAALEDTGPIPPVFRTAAPAGETEVEGMEDSDALVTAAALEQLLANREQFGS